MLQSNTKLSSDILNIQLLDLNDHPISLANLQGKYVVLYFYPEDDTPSCTAEACSFRDYNREIEKLGVKVIGVSKDSVKSHHKFKNKYELNFDLWSDEDLKLHKAFGVWGPKILFGREVIGTRRTTFLIDPAGKVIKVWEVNRSKEHAKEVWEFLKQQYANPKL